MWHGTTTKAHVAVEGGGGSSGRLKERERLFQIRRGIPLFISIHYTLIYYSHLRDLEGHSWYLRHEMLDLCFMYGKALSPVACPACISTDRHGLTPALLAESVISSWPQICLKII